MSVYNLRKAYELERGLRGAAAAAQASKNAAGSISIYSDTEVAEVISEGQAALRSKVDEAIALVEAANEVRAAISLANASSGITALLTEKAGLDAKRGVIVSAFGGRIPSSQLVATDFTAITRQLKNLRTRAETLDYVQETVSVSFVGQEIVDHFSDEVSQIDFRLRAIADEILTANMANSVTLSAKTVDLLKATKLIP